MTREKTIQLLLEIRQFVITEKGYTDEEYGTGNDERYIQCIDKIDELVDMVTVKNGGKVVQIQLRKKKTMAVKDCVFMAQNIVADFGDYKKWMNATLNIAVEQYSYLIADNEYEFVFCEEGAEMFLGAKADE